jgi:hypothetical protein
MVKKIAPVLVLIIFLSGCDIITAPMYPEYTGGLKHHVDLTEEVEEITGGFHADFILAELDLSADYRRILLLVIPLGDGAPEEQLVVLDGHLDVVYTVSPDDGDEYLYRPFIHAADGNAVAGVMVFNPEDGTPGQPLIPHGMTGYGFSAGGYTHFFSVPAGLPPHHTLLYRRYDSKWYIREASMVNIIPPEEQTELTLQGVGFDLCGITINDDGMVSFLLWQDNPDSPLLRVIRHSYESLFDGSLTALFSLTGDEQALPVSSASRIFYTRNNFLIQDRSGTFSRYSLKRPERLLDSMEARSGWKDLFSFSPSGDRMYRFEPDNLRLSSYGTWWGK